MRHVLGAIVAILGVAALASAQSAEELVAKNIEAKGGIQKIKAIKTLRMVGHLQEGGMSVTVGQEGKAPDLMLFHDVEHLLDACVQVYVVDAVSGQLPGRGGVRVEARRQPFDHNVAVGEHSVQPVVVPADWQRTDVVLAHVLGSSG